MKNPYLFWIQGFFDQIEIDLEKGNYEINIYGNSLPEKPIDGINAHLVIKTNKVKIGEINLSEKLTNKENKIKFNIESDKTVRFQIIFDNDLSKDVCGEKALYQIASHALA